MFDLKFPEDDLKKIKTSRSNSELHVKCNFNICAFVYY